MKFTSVLWLFSLFALTSFTLSKEYYGYKASKRKCFMCTYNTKNGWDRCEGPLTEKSAKKYWIDSKECDYNCYLKQDLYGNVERGCYAGEYMVDPNLLGCHWQNNELYCFCEGENCNVQPRMRIKYSISQKVNELSDQQVSGPKTQQNGMLYVSPTKSTKRNDLLVNPYRNNSGGKFYQDLTTEAVRSTVADYEVVPATKHGTNVINSISFGGYGRQANVDEVNKSDKATYHPIDDPKTYYTPIRPTENSILKDRYTAVANDDENDVVDDDTNEDDTASMSYKFKPQKVYAVPSEPSYTVRYPQQPVYVHELASSSPREEAYVIPQKEADPIKAPPVYEGEEGLQVAAVKFKPEKGIQVAARKLEAKKGDLSSFSPSDAKAFYTSGNLKSSTEGEDDKGYNDYHGHFGGSSPEMTIKRYSRPPVERSRGERRYGESRGGHSSGHYRDDLTFNKDGYSASKDVFAHTHSRDDSTKDEATSRHAVKDGGSLTKTKKHKFREEKDRGERHKNIHFVDGDHLREHEEDHYVHERDKYGKMNHKESHKVHKTDEDSYKKKDRKEDHYRYDTDLRDVMAHRKTTEDTGSRGFDKKYGSLSHHSNQGNTNSGSSHKDLPYHMFGYESAASGSSKDKVLDVNENHQKYDKDSYYKLNHEEANGLHGSLQHVAGHDIKDHDEEGFDKKHKDHQDFLDERGSDRDYTKHGHSRHKGSFHQKHSVKDEYDRGREHEGLLMAHQDYQTARDRRYSATKGHVDEVNAHSHDQSSNTGDNGGLLSDHFGMKDRNNDHHHYDSDHHSDESKDDKHKIGHGDLYKYLKAKDGESGKDVNEFEDSLQYEKEQNTDIHRSPHETTEEHHFKLKTRGRNSRLRLKEREDFSQIKEKRSKERKQKKRRGRFRTGDGQMLRIADSHERAGHGLKTTILLSHGFHPVAP